MVSSLTPHIIEDPVLELRRQGQEAGVARRRPFDAAAIASVLGTVPRTGEAAFLELERPAQVKTDIGDRAWLPIREVDMHLAAEEGDELGALSRNFAQRAKWMFH